MSRSSGHLESTTEHSAARSPNKTAALLQAGVCAPARTRRACPGPGGRSRGRRAGSRPATGGAQCWAATGRRWSTCGSQRRRCGCRCRRRPSWCPTGEGRRAGRSQWRAHGNGIKSAASSANAPDTHAAARYKVDVYGRLLKTRASSRLARLGWVHGGGEGNQAGLASRCCVAHLDGGGAGLGLAEGGQAELGVHGELGAVGHGGDRLLHHF